MPLKQVFRCKAVVFKLCQLKGFSDVKQVVQLNPVQWLWFLISPNSHELKLNWFVLIILKLAQSFSGGCPISAQNPDIGLTLVMCIFDVINIHSWDIAKLFIWYQHYAPGIANIYMKLFIYEKFVDFLYSQYVPTEIVAKLVKWHKQCAPDISHISFIL